jgi:tetratricopeptide (TPR) repeat protein
MGEHNEPTHGYFAYDSTLHIPFILKPHRQSPPFASVIENQVRIIDMMPTVLTLLQIPVPSSVQGESLTPLFYQQKKTLEGLANYCYGECFLPYNKYHFSGIETLRTEPYRFIQNKFHEGVYELYDLKKDPKELVNIIEKEPQVAQELRQKLKEIIELYTEKYDAEMTLDTRTRAALHALGYTIGRKDKPKEGELLPVAQEQIHHHNRLIRANKDIADGKYQEAQEKISKVTDIHPNLLFAHDLQATLNFKIQKYQEAISALNKVIEADDKDTVSRQKRAMCYYGLGDGKKTIEEFQEILKIEPTYDEAKANLWKLYIFHKYEDRALAQIEEEIKNNPRKGFGYFWRAKLLQHQNKWVEAKQDYELSLADPELTYEAHLELIKIYRVLNEFDNAIRSLKACLSFQPDNVSNLFQLALFLKNSDKKEAENLLKKALFLNPKDFSILQHLFHLYLQEENSQDAHELMQKALELKLDEKDIKIFQNALVNLVRLHLKKNEKEMAYEFLRYLLKYEFTPTEKMALIQMLLELDKLHEALNYLIDLTQNYPEFYTAHFSLGQLSFNLKIWNQSIQSFENFLKKYPQKNDDLVLRAYRYLSESYIRNNNIDPAIASLTTYLELHPKESLNTAQEASIKQAETLLQRLKDIKAETLKQEEEKKSPTSENTTHEKK